jgi:ribosomal protein S18 acetylase RimI-like enzyme
MVSLERITDGADAFERCADLFAADPIGSNMVSTVLVHGGEVELLRVHDGERTLGAALAWGPGYTLAALLPGAAAPLADALPTAERVQLFGHAHDAVHVAGRWSERAGGAFTAEQIFRIYRLGDLRIPDVTGDVAVADDSAAPLAAQWSVEFGTETGLDVDPRSAAEQVARVIRNGRLRTWHVDGETVAQLFVSTACFGAVRIGAVYTPPEHRRHGYGSALTAAVAATELARPDVDEVMLNTQASNAATNRLYRRLGFESVGEILILWLEPDVRT